MLWGVALISLMVFLPESPRWELQRGNHERARITMAGMRGIPLIDTAEGRRGDAAMEEELEEMEYFIAKEREVFKNTNYFTSYLRCFSLDRQLWRRTLTGCLIQVFQQLNGQNFYYYYGPTFFSAANVSLNSYEIQFILGIVSWVCTFPALYLIDKAGRRRSLIWGNFVCFVCAFIVAFIGKKALAPAGLPADQVTSAQHAAGNAFIAFAVFHLASFSVAVGPTPWVLLSELYPQELRAKCVSLGSASNWFWNFMLGYFSPPLSKQYGEYRAQTRPPQSAPSHTLFPLDYDLRRALHYAHLRGFVPCSGHLYVPRTPRNPWIESGTGRFIVRRTCYALEVARLGPSRR